MGNKRFDTWLIQIIGPIYDPQSVFFRTEKKAFYANWIGFINLKSVWTGKKSVVCNPVLPYPIPSYQIPSLPQPTRILNTILHLYKILLPYTTLSYHIEIEPNQSHSSAKKRLKCLCTVHLDSYIKFEQLSANTSYKKRNLKSCGLRAFKHLHTASQHARGMLLLSGASFHIWAKSWENLFMPCANYKGTDQPAHPHGLISAFVVCCPVV